MGSYDERPWLARYGPGQPGDIELEYGSALEMFSASARRAPDTPIVRYFDGALTLRELDELTDAFACGVHDRGVTAGERIALYLHDVPQFVIGVVGSWKAGAIAVPVNPTSRERELQQLLSDSGATVLVCLEGLYRAVAGAVVDRTDVTLTITTSELEYQSRDDQRSFAGVARIENPGTQDMSALLDRFRGRQPPAAGLKPDDVAFLTYTSGTTGPPKGAMNTHRNVVFSAQTYRNWIGIGRDDVIVGIAPLSHITGLIGHIAVSLLASAPLVLCYRFEPSTAIETIREHGATFTVGPITAFIALMNARNADRDALATLTKIYSGGEPVPPSTVRAFWEQFGRYIHNSYGLTETTSPSHGVPLHADAPVDGVSGALSVGVPVYNTVARIVGDDGAELPPGELGEIVTSAPEVVPGYWNQPEESERALGGGRLRTGDVGYMDHDGWFYLVDRT